nr:hypothetical protein WOLCODRAFT_144277 [Ipomoea trifida]
MRIAGEQLSPHFRPSLPLVDLTCFSRPNAPNSNGVRNSGDGAQQGSSREELVDGQQPQAQRWSVGIGSPATAALAVRQSIGGERTSAWTAATFSPIPAGEHQGLDALPSYHGGSPHVVAQWELEVLLESLCPMGRYLCGVDYVEEYLSCGILLYYLHQWMPCLHLAYEWECVWFSSL